MSDKEMKKDNGDENKIEIEIKENNESKVSENSAKPEQKTEMPSEEMANSEVEELLQRVRELEETNSDLNDRLLRRLAEFENYKRRSENDQLNLLKYAAEGFIGKILPVYDDLNRSMLHADDDKNTKSLVEGLKLVLDKFSKILEDQGVKKIETKGMEFDVDLHDALLQQPSEEIPQNFIIEEIEPGYRYKDKVIRHAKVIVSTGQGSYENK